MNAKKTLGKGQFSEHRLDFGSTNSAPIEMPAKACLLYTSDAADEME